MPDLIDRVPAASQGGARIDTVGDVTKDLARRFPKDAYEILAWADSYFRVLGSLPPKALRDAFYATIDGWEYQKPPKPADFKKHIPAGATASATREMKQIDDRLDRARHARHLVTDAMRRYGDGNGQSYRSVLTRFIERRAYALCSGTPRPLPDRIDLTPEELEQLERSAADHATTTVRSGGDGMHQAARARTVRPSPTREARRDEMKRIAAQYHEEQGDPLTDADRDALWQQADQAQQGEAL